MTYYNNEEKNTPQEVGAFMALLAQKIEQSNRDYERTLRQYESLLAIVQEMDKRSDINESDLKVTLRDVEQIHLSIEKQGKRIGETESQLVLVKTTLDRWDSALKTITAIFTIVVTVAGLWFAFLQSTDSNKKQDKLPPQYHNNVAQKEK